MPYIHCNINFVRMYTIQVHSREILFVWPSCLTAVKPHCLGANVCWTLSDDQ